MKPKGEKEEEGKTRRSSEKCVNALFKALLNFLLLVSLKQLECCEKNDILFGFLRALKITFFLCANYNEYVKSCHEDNSSEIALEILKKWK